MRHWIAWLLWLSVGTLRVGTAAAAEIAVFPQDLRLTGPEARQRIIVQEVHDGLTGRQVREGLQIRSADEGVAIVLDETVLPRGNGRTHLRVVVGDRFLEVPVVVEHFDQPHVWSFRNQVQSVLTKAGCNMGACHGAAAGKNGFKLSLRGYDPEGDYFALTRQARGRRIVPHDPGHSLILTKPTGLIPHKGGVRFEEDSLEYRVLAEWIAQGQPAPQPNDPRIQRLEILPPQIHLSPGDRQQFLVRAHFTDGHVEDVTRWAKYSSTNHSVGQVDDNGLVQVVGSGEAAIVAWYLAQNVTATVSVPYHQTVAEELFASTPRNLIDEQVLAKLRALRMPPSPLCSDAEFLRRATLDTIGMLPTPDAVRSFLADDDPLKREKLVEDLLTRPEFVDYWSYKWSDLFLLSGERLRPQALKTFYQWIRDRVSENASWDQIARGILLAQGSTFQNGAANFYALHQDPQDMAETVSMAFLGMSINCARCHDHPLEKWTNDDYYGMVSLFARVRGKGWGGDFRNGDGNRTIFLAERGEVIQPRTGKPQRPRPLDGVPLDFETPGDRRVVLADWLTAKDNPYFSKAIVNRVWANFFGIGLVDKVDDLRLTNPPSHPQLFQQLADDLADNGYNLKTLMRLILTSETYQRSAQVLLENAQDQRFFARFYPRRLSAEVLLDAVSQVTGVPTVFKDYPVGTRALQLPDASVASYFLETFGRPDRLITCTCERSDAPSMTQVLHLTNGKTLLEKLESPDGRIAQLAASDWSNEQIVEELYLSALSRYPTSEERSQLVSMLSQTPSAERRAALEDLCWSILTSREFLFQH